MKNHYTINSLVPLRDSVFVTEIESGDKVTKSGLIIPDDNMSNRGIRPRWCKVFSIGPDVTDVSVGDYLLVQHGKWTQRMSMNIGGEDVDLWRVDYPKSVELVCDEDPRGRIVPKGGQNASDNKNHVPLS